ncbi:hypothetical protein DNFV4_00320 [Nitrospira tepida]|uniref:Uncharacterized protein n=1 Tax=Nitrospira tepida TaxID=2973512 RepID=A0AA86T157_9BACT|nr:hypothetical protein [Nitrospira tepida]CAI4029900.1 hypothetical protein DNFV4_00320 [Nitrospira tepida]
MPLQKDTQYEKAVLEYHNHPDGRSDEEFRRWELAESQKTKDMSHGYELARKRLEDQKCIEPRSGRYYLAEMGRTRLEELKAIDQDPNLRT